MKLKFVNKHTVLEDDILRYKKNKLPATLALLALVFDVLYFTLLYAVHASEVYTILIGVSVIVNLLVLLVGFYASEGIKSYNKVSSIMLLVLAAVQFARIFIYPLRGLSGKWMSNNAYFGIVMTPAANGTLMIVYLAASAACFVAAAVIGYFNIRRLEEHLKKVESGELSIESELKAAEEAEEASANSAEQTEQCAEAHVQETTVVSEGVPSSETSEEVDNG